MPCTWIKIHNYPPPPQLCAQGISSILIVPPALKERGGGQNFSTSFGMRFCQAPLCRYRFKAKSRKYQGVFEVKSRVKTWQVRGIWSQQLEH